MCLITLAYQSHPEYPLLIAANRDEFYARPTAAAEFWQEAPQLLAGRDLQAGGTWMGITRNGRFAAITNHRDPSTTPVQPRSRGMLTLDFLLGQQTPADYLAALAQEAGSYAGFNLLLGDRGGLYYLSNMEGVVKRLQPGIYSLSNGLLDSAWPKQQQAAAGISALLDEPAQHELLKATVSDRTQAAEHLLPETGIGPAMEQLLSAQFIVSEDYGTRATTSLWINHTGEVEFSETSYLAGGIRAETRHWEFNLTGRG